MERPGKGNPSSLTEFSVEEGHEVEVVAEEGVQIDRDDLRRANVEQRLVVGEPGFGSDLRLQAK